VDLGAGEGGYVLHRARTDPTTFAIAVDASPDGLVDGAWKAKRARLGNLAFLVEGIERLPCDLACLADEVTVHFPWGSLLRGLLDADPRVVLPIASLLHPAGEFRVLLSATARDGYADLGAEALSRSAPDFAGFGLELREVRPAAAADVAASRSSWAKRLGPTRPVVYARYSRRSSRRGLMSPGTPAAPVETHSTWKRPS
jgi:16S rRNA (adenine(1408)-N(1))-methyltransferase